MAKVFIGMPVYNGKRYIKRAIDSMIVQTFQDWKLLISDDASTDDTSEICRSYAKVDPRIEYYRQSNNIGLFNNFKYVLDRADSEYFIWCAQDDIREKEYLKTCIEHLENDKKLGFATTKMAAIDSFDRILTVEHELTKLSGKPSIVNVAKYVLQPEISGKCNLMYGLFRTEAARAVWNAFPQRNVWGQDYMFSLALVSRFGIFVDDKVLFKKRMGGFSSPGALDKDTNLTTNKIEYRNPKNHIFPFLRFKAYLMGHMEALRGTRYRPLAAILLTIRLPRAFLIYIRERNIKKYFKGTLTKS